MKKLMITTMLLGSMAQNAFAQKIEIKGTVRDASDKSIEYVNVVLQTIDSTFVACGDHKSRRRIHLQEHGCRRLQTCSFQHRV